uniref:Uncharacterized protein n=1 Tax=Anopheles dirus TaxID=7168 RepID=A0A182NPM4_9DIPT
MCDSECVGPPPAVQPSASGSSAANGEPGNFSGQQQQQQQQQQLLVEAINPAVGQSLVSSLSAHSMQTEMPGPVPPLPAGSGEYISVPELEMENHWLREKLKEVTADRDRLLCEVANLRLELDMAELKRLPEHR